MKMNIGILIFNYTSKLSYYNDWIDAFNNLDSCTTVLININDGNEYSKFKKQIENYNLIVLMHSVTCAPIFFNANNDFSSVLKSRKCKLIALIGDELNLINAPMSSKLSFLKDIEADYIGTQLLLGTGEWLYSSCNKSKVIALPHALNPTAFYSENSQNERKVDFGTISIKYPTYLGDNEREELFNLFVGLGNSGRYRVDVRDIKKNDQRLNRKQWAEFLGNCKGTISNEAGTYFIEPNDAIINEIEKHVRDISKAEGKFYVSSESVFRKVWNSCPVKLKNFIHNSVLLSSFIEKQAPSTEMYIDEIGYEKIYELFFKNRSKGIHYSKAISSRHFDAIGTKTCQILLEGRYNDILTKGEHYFSLNKDYSNLEEILDLFNNDKSRAEVSENALSYVLQNHTHQKRVEYAISLI